MKFEVLRQHQGDRMYLPGDIRDVKRPEDVAHLVDKGVLKSTASGKATQKPANKAAPKPANKAG